MRVVFEIKLATLDFMDGGTQTDVSRLSICEAVRAREDTKKSICLQGLREFEKRNCLLEM